MSFWASQEGNFKKGGMRRKTTSLTVLPVLKQKVLNEVWVAESFCGQCYMIFWAFRMEFVKG